MKRRPREHIDERTCLSCGACCIAPYNQDSFCDVDEKDMKRMGTPLVRRLVRHPEVFDLACAALDGRAAPSPDIETKKRRVRLGVLRGVTTCQCAALKGDPMHSVQCSIYEVRPSVCRVAVKPGDRTCRQIRGLIMTLVEREHA